MVSELDISGTRQRGLDGRLRSQKSDEKLNRARSDLPHASVDYQLELLSYCVSVLDSSTKFMILRSGG